MRSKAFIFSLTVLATCQPAFAWGPEGHRIIGRAAWELLDDEARQEVSAILGDPSPGQLAETLSVACNWPDTIRGEPVWKWSSPLHYVNIPRSSNEYIRERDCPDGRCVTEGILQFANQLAYEDLAPEKRWQAFSFVCHLVADLHQPLHAGFRDDRGANTVDIEYRGEEWNLHQFWDGVVVREYLEDEGLEVKRLVKDGRAASSLDWQPGQVKTWTEDSHALAVSSAYPNSVVIDSAFAEKAWEITLSQWELAAARLAQVLNAVLGETEVSAGN
jgi:hypothetical protein